MSKQSCAKKLIETLNQKSDKAIQAAKQTILEEKFSQENVNQAIQQYVARWNDATRPGTLALSYEIAGGQPDGAVSLQTALLLIDATMDIHDDIIDGSTAKKNLKTIYGKLGKEAALLLGDAFMVEGFSQLHKAILNLSQERQEQIIATVHNFLSEVVDAHITEAQLKTKKWNISPEVYLQVLTKKAADIDGRMKAGAIYGGGTQREVEALSKLGRNLGILLFIRAEFVDIFEADELGNRVKNECLPLPILYAIQNKTAKAKIRKSLNKVKIGKEDCEAVLEVLDKSTNVLTLKNYLLKLKEESDKLVESLNENQARKTLQQVVASLLEDL
jgi:geranylgeranyl pyrophosphate synthase